MQPSGCAVVRQRHFKAVVRTFLIGGAVLLVVGCAGVRSEAPQEKQGHTEATKEQARSARCEGTRTYQTGKGIMRTTFTTNDVPGCPKGGLLPGTDKKDNLRGKHGDDEIHGLSAADFIDGGLGNDVIYGGPGRDLVLDGKGEDVIYGGAGNDWVILESGFSEDGQRDKVYCGPGKDEYAAGENDYVDSSCEEEHRPATPDPGDFISTPPKAGEDSSIPAAFH